MRFTFCRFPLELARLTRPFTSEMTSRALVSSIVALFYVFGLVATVVAIAITRLPNHVPLLYVCALARGTICSLEIGLASMSSSMYSFQLLQLLGNVLHDSCRLQTSYQSLCKVQFFAGSCTVGR